MECLYHPDYPILSPGGSFVIAALNLNFLKEITWPGQVDIGTGVRRIGTSSIRLYQQLFQGETCVATAETVIVQVNAATASSEPLSEAAKATLSRWLLPEP